MAILAACAADPCLIVMYGLSGFVLFSKVDGFRHLKLLNLEDNFIADWNIIVDSLSSLPQ